MASLPNFTWTEPNKSWNVYPFYGYFKCKFASNVHITFSTKELNSLLNNGVGET